MQYDKLIRGNIVTPQAVLDGGYVAISGEKIAYVGLDKPGSAKETLDYEGAWVFPGVIDAQVHSRSQLNQEGFVHSTAAAAAGGVTTIIDMPYDEGLLVCDRDSVLSKASDVESQARVDVGIYGTINPEHGTRYINDQIDAGVCAFKFSTFGTDPVRFPRIPPYLLRDAFATIAPSGLSAGVHNENNEVVLHDLQRVKDAGLTDYTAHGLSHSDFAEALAMVEIYETGAYTGCRAHVVHCSIGRGMDICEGYRRQGFDATVEVCIHYLCFNEEEDVARVGGLAKINPPIRPQAEVDKLWRSLGAGMIDMVSTDHVAWSLNRKNNPNMLKNNSGGPSLEVLLPMLIKGCLAHGIELPMAARVLCDNPARHFRISTQKGALAVGCDADLAIVDPQTAPWRVSQSKTVADWSLYDGIEMPQVKETFLRGQRVWDGTDVIDCDFGRYITP